MKNLLVLMLFIILTSFSTDKEPIKLSDGNYITKLDTQYTKNGLLDFKFKIDKNLFIIKIADKTEELEMIWVDENSFIVKGYTEPKKPTDFEESLLKNYRPTFNIIKQIDDEYYFTLGQESDESPIYSGKFLRLRKP